MGIRATANTKYSIKITITILLLFQKRVKPFKL